MKLTHIEQTAVPANDPMLNSSMHSDEARAYVRGVVKPTDPDAQWPAFVRFGKFEPIGYDFTVTHTEIVTGAPSEQLVLPLIDKYTPWLAEGAITISHRFGDVVTTYYIGQE